MIGYKIGILIIQSLLSLKEGGEKMVYTFLILTVLSWVVGHTLINILYPKNKKEQISKEV
jgi:Na+/H+-dicarboxylate symporter